MLQDVCLVIPTIYISIDFLVSLVEGVKGPTRVTITPTVLSQEVEFNQWRGDHLHAIMTQSLLGIRQMYSS